MENNTKEMKKYIKEITVMMEKNTKEITDKMEKNTKESSDIKESTDTIYVYAKKLKANTDLTVIIYTLILLLALSVQPDLRNLVFAIASKSVKV